MTAAGRKKPPDPGKVARSAQSRASKPEVSSWVGANAGTGKTYVLTRRVLRLLLNGAAPARILCLTFTKAAAAEMTNRIARRLGEWALMGNADLRKDLREVTGRAPDKDEIRRARTLFATCLDVPGGMRIQTIHAFCQAVLKRFPLGGRGAAPFPGHRGRRSARPAGPGARRRTGRGCTGPWEVCRGSGAAHPAWRAGRSYQIAWRIPRRTRTAARPSEGRGGGLGGRRAALSRCRLRRRDDGSGSGCLRLRRRAVRSRETHTGVAGTGRRQQDGCQEGGADCRMAGRRRSSANRPVRRLCQGVPEGRQPAAGPSGDPGCGQIVTRHPRHHGPGSGSARRAIRPQEMPAHR